MKKYLTITVREQMQGMTVEKVLYDYLELTKSRSVVQNSARMVFAKIKYSAE